MEQKEGNVIWLCDIPQQRNIETKPREKIISHQQLAYETEEKRKNHEIKVKVMPLIIGSGVNAIQNNIKNIFTVKTATVKIVKEMQKMVLMESELMETEVN